MDFLGKKYELVSSEHFEDYLVYSGVGYLQRKLAVKMKPVQCLTRNDDGTYSYHTISTLINSSVTFTPGVEFEEVLPNINIKVQAVITLEANKIIHTQKDENGRIVTHLREFFPDKLIVTTTADDFDKIVMRNYVSVQ